MSMIESLAQCFRDKHWRYQNLGDNVLGTIFDDIPMTLHTYDEDNSVVLNAYVVYDPRSKRIAKRMRRDLTRYLSAINFRLASGLFVLDERDGEVSYRITITANAGSVDPEQLESAIKRAVLTVIRFAPMIGALMYGKRTLKQALEDLDR